MYKIICNISLLILQCFAFELGTHIVILNFEQR